jgi:endonuclease G
MRKQSTLFFCILCVILISVSCRKAHTRNKGRYVRSEKNVRTNQLVSTETTPENVVTVSEKQFTPKKTPSKEEVLLCRIAYKLSYNTETRQPNWVAWTLTRDHSDGPYSRKGVPYYDDNGNIIGISSSPTDVVRGDYIVDKDVSCPRQEHIDWKEHPIGIDHGHMCPAADCKWNKGAMNQSFLLTNICPQDHDLNGGDWDKLEKKCRTWAKQYGQIYIVAGPIFISEEKSCFGVNQIPIPDAFFKVVLCITGNPKAIGFVFLNSGTHQNLKEYVQTVDEVEKITGIDFFQALPDDIENEVEAKSDIGEW